MEEQVNKGAHLTGMNRRRSDRPLSQPCCGTLLARESSARSAPLQETNVVLVHGHSATAPVGAR